MRLYNTLSRTLEMLTPLKPGEVSLYTCGPTVYDYAHIGNLRTFLFEDTLRRVLEAEGYKVRHVMNITDVGHLASDADEGEDKLEKGAAREGKSVLEVARHYTEAFLSDAAALNILPPNAYPQGPGGYAPATEFIPQQVTMVERLIERGFAYETEEAVYFEVSKLPDYGKLSGQKLSGKEVAVRDEVIADPDKRHPFDFAVWFKTVGHFADHALRWPSPWGEGFPGWHLECSAIIEATLGSPIDIHTGGVDHIGTHHTNEIAQTEGAYGHELARIWLHGEFVLGADQLKMSKSKENFATLAGLREAGYHPLVYRLLVLQAHYRSQLTFSTESLEAARNTLLNLYAWADLVHQREGEAAELDEIRAHLRDDLDTPGALAALYRLTDLAAPGPETLTELDRLFGLNLSGRPDITPEQKELIARRQAARAEKDWAESDKLRGELAAQHLAIEDTPNGPRWRRIKL